MLARYAAKKRMQDNFEALFRKKGIYQRVAHDGNLYKSDHTELTTLKECEFHEAHDGKLIADISKTPSYAKYYAPGGRLNNELQVEMMVLGQYLGIQFDPATSYHQQLIISDPRSIELLRHAGVVIEKQAATAGATSANASLFAPTNPTPSLDMDAVKKAQAKARSTQRELVAKKTALDREWKTNKNELDLLGKIVRRQPISIDGNQTEKLTLPAVIGEQPLLDSFYTLRDLLKKKFHITPPAEWHPTSNTIDIHLHFSHHQILSDLYDASSFLHSISGNVQRRGGYSFGYFSHRLTQPQCDAAVAALRFSQNKTAKEVEQTQSRPEARW